MKFQKLAKTTLIILCISLSVSSYSLSRGASLSAPITTSTKPVDPVAIDPLARLLEIKEMNKQNLSRADKKSLRKEVKEIRKKLKVEQRGVYLSVGAIIIIILLLILLL